MLQEVEQIVHAGKPAKAIAFIVARAVDGGGRWPDD
jgi:hypothetical protein